LRPGSWKSQYSNYKKNRRLGLENNQTIRNNIAFSILTIIGIIEKNKKNNNVNNKRYTGQVVNLNSKDKYGFIKSNSFKGNIFFHFSSLSKNTIPRLNDKLTFIVKKNRKGNYAIKTRIIKRSTFKSNMNRENKEITVKINKDIYRYVTALFKEFKFIMRKIIKNIG